MLSRHKTSPLFEQAPPQGPPRGRTMPNAPRFWERRRTAQSGYPRRSHWRKTVRMFNRRTFALAAALALFGSVGALRARTPSLSKWSD